MNLIAIAVPAYLPIAISIGTLYSLKRLRKAKIFCIAPQRVSVSGRVAIMVFDKTGTLTEDD